MHRYIRFALSYAPNPETDLAVLGKHWLGWDLDRGQQVPLLKVDRLPLPLAKVAARRRRYGCQALMVAPFRLAAGHSPLDLHHRARAVAEQCSAVTMAGLRLAQQSDAIALVPRDPNPDLDRLCATVTRSFYDLQIPTDGPGLSLHAGHPPDPLPFRFEFSDPLPGARLSALTAVMRPLLEPNLPSPFHLRSLSLMGEDARGWFRLIQRYPLRASGPSVAPEAPIREDRPRLPLHW